MEAFEHPPNVGMIFDADHYLAFARTHKVRHSRVILERKIHSIPCCFPVRRFHVVKRMRSVVALNAVIPRQVLDIGLRQALPGGRQVLFDSQQVDGRPGGSRTKGLSCNFSAEGMMLEIEEALRAGCLSEFQPSSPSATQTPGMS
jgi:hypothetical protein